MHSYLMSVEGRSFPRTMRRKSNRLKNVNSNVGTYTSYQLSSILTGVRAIRGSGCLVQQTGKVISWTSVIACIVFLVRRSLVYHTERPPLSNWGEIVLTPEFWGRSSEETRPLLLFWEVSVISYNTASILKQPDPSGRFDRTRDLWHT